MNKLGDLSPNYLKMNIRLLLILLLIIVVQVFFSCSSETEKPDFVLYNAKIWTGNETNPWGEWISIKGDAILDIGTGNAPQGLDNLDLEGKLMIPGFNDSHVHFASAGHLLFNINLLDVNDSALFKERIREAAQRLPVGSWITRGDWGAYEAWQMGSEGGQTRETAFQPHRRIIDDLTPNHPVLVTRYDRKVGLANRLALDFLGIESESGILNQALLEDALGKIPDKSMEQRFAETRRALHECRKYGVTTVQDMSPLDQVAIYQELKNSGELTCRINFSPSRLSDLDMMVEKGWVINWAGEDGPAAAGDDWISFGTLKTHIDGIMGARTARFYEPYADNGIETPVWRGGWREFSRDLQNFKELILKADNLGIQLRIHAIGDEANSILLDILDTMDMVNGKRDRRFRLVHAQVISSRDFSRFAGRNIIAEVQPYHVTDDMRWMEERIGNERCKGAYAFKTLEENGCILSFGSDWPGTNASYYPINPLYGIYAAVTRQTLQGKPDEGWFPEQKISLEKALKAYTFGSAFSAFEERKKGTLEKGKLADLIVLDEDLFVTEPEKWLNNSVLYTMVGGKFVFKKSEYEN